MRKREGERREEIGEKERKRERVRERGENERRDLLKYVKILFKTDIQNVVKSR